MYVKSCSYAGLLEEVSVHIRLTFSLYFNYELKYYSTLGRNHFVITLFAFLTVNNPEINFGILLSVRINGNKEWSVVDGLDISDYARSMLDITGQVSQPKSVEH
jgi:hypothetical protein